MTGVASVAVVLGTWLLHEPLGWRIVGAVGLILSGSAVVSEEISDRTIGYVFTRPISRPGFLIGRWLATLLSLVAAVTLGVGLLLVAAGPARVIDLGLRFSGAILAGALLGATVYATVFAALGAWFRHPMMVGLGYAFAMELLLANLPGTTMELAIQYHLRAFLLGNPPRSTVCRTS